MKRDWFDKKLRRDAPKRKEGFRHLPLGYQELDRKQRMKIWLRDRDMTLADLAEKCGIHFSYPGKILIARTEKPSPEVRERLLAAGIPEDML